jgi:spore germination protein KB
MCYIVYLGYETLTRTAEILNPLFIFFLIGVYFLIVFTGKVDLSNLKPVLANGFDPVVKAAFPSGTIFPFAETALIFLMFFKYTKDKQGIFKIFFYANLVSTILIIISTTVIICTLGPDYGSTVVSGFVEVIKNINIADVLTNMDAIGIIMLFIGVFYKTIIYLLGAILAFSTLFGIKNYRWTIIPVGIVVTWYSTIFEPNYPYHLWLGFYVTINYIHPIFVLSMPVLILLIALLKRKTGKCSKKLPA